MTTDGWPMIRLGDILSEPIRNGISPVDSPTWTGVQMLGLGCLTENGFQPRQLKNAPSPSYARNAPSLRDGDLLISRANTRELVGLVGIYRNVGTPCIYPDLMMRLRVSDMYRSDFLQIVLRSPEVRQRINALAQGTSGSMVKISAAALRRLMIPRVPVSEQRRIVSVIDAVSAREGDIEASIAKLTSVRRGLLLAALAPVGAGVPPEGWIRLPLKDVVPRVEYGISNALDMDPNGVPVLRMNNLRGSRMDVSDLRYCHSPIPRAMKLRCGDVLFNRTNSIDHVGKSCLWRQELPVATFASYLVRINPDPGRLIPEYLVEWLMHPLIRQRVRAISTVAVQQVNVNPSRLLTLSIDMPLSLADQRKIVDSLQLCDNKIDDARTELKKLRLLKLGLVVDLLAGKAQFRD